MFNIGRDFLLPVTDEELQGRGPSLVELMQAFAMIDHGWSAPRRQRRRRPLSVESVETWLADAGSHCGTDANFVTGPSRNVSLRAEWQSFGRLGTGQRRLWGVASRDILRSRKACAAGE